MKVAGSRALAGMAGERPFEPIRRHRTRKPPSPWWCRPSLAAGIVSPRRRPLSDLRAVSAALTTTEHSAQPADPAGQGVGKASGAVRGLDGATRAGRLDRKKRAPAADPGIRRYCAPDPRPAGCGVGLGQRPLNSPLCAAELEDATHRLAQALRGIGRLCTNSEEIVARLHGTTTLFGLT